MRKEIRDLLLDISKCEELDNSHSICNEIIDLQRNKEEWQIPEPWSGDLSKAPILFICLNPSVDERQFYPIKDSKEWTDDRIIDYFTNLFDEERKFVKNGLRPKRKNGTYGLPREWVRNWAFIRSWYCQLTEKKKEEVQMGLDYTITDIVHCKSKKGRGVNDKIIGKCTSLYLKRILENARAEIIIVLGNKARIAISNLFDLPDHSMFKIIPFEMKDKKKYFLFLHHTNYRKKGEPKSPIELLKVGKMHYEVVEFIKRKIGIEN